MSLLLAFNILIHKTAAITAEKSHQVITVRLQKKGAIISQTIVDRLCLRHFRIFSIPFVLSTDLFHLYTWKSLLMNSAAILHAKRNIYTKRATTKLNRAFDKSPHHHIPKLHNILQKSSLPYTKWCYYVSFSLHRLPIPNNTAAFIIIIVFLFYLRQQFRLVFLHLSYRPKREI